MVCIDLTHLQQSGFTDFLHDEHWRNLQKLKCNCSINDCKLFKHKLPWPKVMYCAHLDFHTENPWDFVAQKLNVLPIEHFYEPDTARTMMFGSDSTWNLYSDLLHFWPAQQLTVWSN